MATKKDIDNYFALGKKIRDDVIHLSEVLAENGFEKVIPGELIGLKFDAYLCPVGTRSEDIVSIYEGFNDPEHETFSVETNDRDGGTDTWTVPTSLFCLPNDKALLKKIGEMKKMKMALEEKEKKADARRAAREKKRAEKAEHDLFLRLKEKFEGGKK